MTRIGLFGGSFDPVHNAHVALAQTALWHLRLGAVRWIPAGQPWQKDRVMTAGEHRAAMVALAITGEPRFVLDLSELDRAGPSYMIETLEARQAAQPGCEWFLILGQDQYAQFDTWHRWQDLLPRVTLAVAGRAGDEPQAPAALAGVAGLAHGVVTLPLPPMAISATAIRQRVARGEAIDDVVPWPVARYIEQHHLYK